MDKPAGHGQNEIIKVSEKEYLSMVYGGSAAGESVQPFDQEIFLIETHIAGPEYQEGYPETIKRLKRGMHLTLIREPDNEHDDLAIQVWDDKKRMIGYVPRQRNIILAHLMDAGKYLYAVVKKKENYYGPDTARINIFMRDYVPISLNSGLSVSSPLQGQTLDHPERTDLTVFQIVKNWQIIAEGVCKIDLVQEQFQPEKPMEVLAGDLVCLLMSLLKTDAVYTEQDIPVAYEVVRRYLEKYGWELPQKLYDLFCAGHAASALLTDSIYHRIPRFVEKMSWIDRKELKKDPHDYLEHSPIWMTFSIFGMFGTNFLSIYNHSAEGEQALKNCLNVIGKRIEEYVGGEVNIGTSALEQVREDDLYVGTDGLKGWIDGR